ncbi:MAG: (2Fe-2S) ferredoxin domain-containing protein, partial [Candidatus Brocadiaceae bacterium]
MKRLTSVEDLRSLQQLLAERQDPGTPTLVVSAGTCGRASGADGVIQAAEDALGLQGLTESIRLRVTGCHGFCEVEPSVLVEPRGTFYARVAPDDMPRIVAAVAQGAIVEGLLFVDPATGEPVERQKDIPFFRRQVRALLGF